MLRKLIASYLKELQLSGKAPSTVGAYGYHLDRLADWCEQNDDSNGDRIPINSGMQFP